MDAADKLERHLTLPVACEDYEICLQSYQGIPVLTLEPRQFEIPMGILEASHALHTCKFPFCYIINM